MAGDCLLLPSNLRPRAGVVVSGTAPCASGWRSHGSASLTDLAPLARISQVVAEANGDLVAFENLEGKLTLDGLDRFEAAVGLRARNANETRDRYLT